MVDVLAVVLAVVFAVVVVGWMVKTALDKKTVTGPKRGGGSGDMPTDDPRTGPVNPE